jgi:HEPN domain-containing protein
MDNKEQSETPLHLKLSIATSLNTRMGDKIEKLEAAIEHKDKYIKELQDKYLQDVDTTTRNQLLQEIRHNDELIETLQEDAKNIANNYSKEQIRCIELERKLEEEEDHNRELVVLINEMMEMIKEWHSEDKQRTINIQESRDATVRRYKRDMDNMGV